MHGRAAELRFGVVGTNFITDKFIEAASLTEGVRVSAVYSRTDERGERYAREQGIPTCFSDYREFLSSGIDAVYIASPHCAHFEQAVLAMESGLHVLCEKMLTTTRERAEEMRRVSRERGVVLVEAMRPDFDPITERLRSELSGLGKILRAELVYEQYSSRYDAHLRGEYTNAFNPKMGNSALADIGIYPLRMAVNLFGIPDTLGACSKILECGFEGEGELRLGYGDMTVRIAYSKIREGVLPSAIVGERGSLYFDRINAPNYIKIIRADGGCVTVDTDPVDNNMIYELAAFRDAIRGERDLTRYLDMAVDTVSLVNEAHRLSGAAEYLIL